MKTTAVILATGFEEVEAITPIDYLRRCGVNCTIISIVESYDSHSSWPSSYMVCGSHNMYVAADIGIEGLTKEYDCLILPGGSIGAKNLADSSILIEAIKKQNVDGRYIAAICASPFFVLIEACGLLSNKNYTYYPGVDKEAKSSTANWTSPGNWQDKKVVRDGNIITARSAGCAQEFSFAIVRALLGENAEKELAEAVLM